MSGFPYTADVDHEIGQVVAEFADCEFSEDELGPDVSIAGRLVLSRDQGKMAIVLVEQYFDFARELADTYAVMERGEVVMAGDGKTMVESEVRRHLTV